MNIVKATSLIAAALMAAGSGAAAQEYTAPSPITYLRPVTFPVLAPVPALRAGEEQAAAPQPAASPDRRDDIKLLEGLLTMAVKSGADKLALQMRASEPGSLFVIDTGRTRGFDLQGYGVFFDVDVPMMKQSVLYVTRQLNQQDTRAQLENSIATLPDGPLRDLAIRELRRTQQPGVRQPGVASATQIAQPGVVTGQVADAAGPEIDPNQLYTEAVKTALIDAMLKYSVGLKLGADEWLTVAARDAGGPPAPGQVDDASTIVIRIRGADLTAFHAGKLTREDVLKKVEVKEL
jgi:hypothetical protein